MKAIKNQLIAYFLSGCKSENLGKLGIELEHFVVDGQGDSVPYDGACGIEAILRRLQPCYDEAEYSNAHLIALKRKNCLISLEPAGQLEVSIGEFLNIKEVADTYARFLAELEPILDEMGLHLCTLGYRPRGKARDFALIPKERYRHMDAYFRDTGIYGTHMMRGTGSTQVSIDYFDETDCMQKMRLASVLCPLFAILTDNTPIFENATAPMLTRARIWEQVDPERSGFAFNILDAHPFGFSDYADFILSRPPILVRGLRGLEPSGRKTVAELYRDGTESRADIEHVLSMFFPYVRLKNYIEIRVADSMPIAFAMGYLALVKGIFYSVDNLKILSERFLKITQADAVEAFARLKESGLSATVYGQNAKTWLVQLLELARTALDEHEQQFLLPLYRLIDDSCVTRPLNLMGRTY